jgi:hypothetical protein
VQPLEQTPRDPSTDASKHPANIQQAPNPTKFPATTQPKPSQAKPIQPSPNKTKQNKTKQNNTQQTKQNTLRYAATATPLA